MLTMPGTPVLLYGEDIGMGENLALDERNSTRTPMQWSNEPNAGFSKASPDHLIRPVVDHDQFSYEQVNVISQRRDPKSLLNWMERAIRMRKECPEFGWGKWQIIDTGHPNVFAHRCEWKEGVVVAVHNLSKEPCTVTLKLGDDDSKHLTELLGDQTYEQLQDASREVQLEGYGYRWFRVGELHL
jgi:maltose alpha-D-glucosyltransferase/alpha-amylase